MNMNAGGQTQKVTTEHLKRTAYLYVRQSTLRQVIENTESTERQYALRQRAIALGWPADRIIVIDDDQGRSAGTSEYRSGFQHLVSEVGVGRAGIVMGLEVSRLARNNSDWHRLLEICALSQTLILDEDGVYDPAYFNDRLLLGMKGTMSEAELYVLRARLHGGALNKARRGDLRMPLPTGFVYDAAGCVALDPDQQVRESIRLFFRTFQQTGSVCATVKGWREQGHPFPRRLRSGPQKGEIVWGGITEGRALMLLRNPRYAGAFTYGRTRCRRGADGKIRQDKQARDDWIALHIDQHEGYISWDGFEENQKRLRANAQARSMDHRHTPPREGPALLQGIVVCGVCGSGMTVRYHHRAGRLLPEYVCQRQKKKDASPICQSIPGAGTDAAIGRLLLELVKPLTLEVSLAVQQEVQARFEEAESLRYRDVQRAKYEADLARQRYMRVDPNNRLVADALEADWNDKLRAHAAALEEHERRRKADQLVLDDEQRQKILALANDFPRLWNDAKTPARERKRMVRLLIEDVTVVKGDQITAHVRFRGGTAKTMRFPREQTSWEKRQTPPEVVAEIDRLLDEHTDGGVAEILNREGYVSGEGKPFHGKLVSQIRRARGVKSRSARLCATGLLTLDEIANRLGISKWVVKQRRAAGSLGVRAHRVDDVGRFMYEDPEAPAAAPATVSAQEA